MHVEDALSSKYETIVADYLVNHIVSAEFRFYRFIQDTFVQVTRVAPFKGVGGLMGILCGGSLPT